jgi:hypothetical protein
MRGVLGQARAATSERLDGLNSCAHRLHQPTDHPREIDTSCRGSAAAGYICRLERCPIRDNGKH